MRLIAPSASPEQAAAIVAALERFMRATAPVLVAAPERVDGWQRAALAENVDRFVSDPGRDPWINA